MSDEQTQTPADAWGQPISAERQAELQGNLDRWAAEAEHGERKGPFDGVGLTGAAVFWLAERVRNKDGYVPDLHLEGARLIEAHLETLYVNLPAPGDGQVRLASPSRQGHVAGGVISRGGPPSLPTSLC